jgi:hypothetical protein
LCHTTFKTTIPIQLSICHIDNTSCKSYWFLLRWSFKSRIEDVMTRCKNHKWENKVLPLNSRTESETEDEGCFSFILGYMIWTEKREQIPSHLATKRQVKSSECLWGKEKVKRSFRKMSLMMRMALILLLISGRKGIKTFLHRILNTWSSAARFLLCQQSEHHTISCIIFLLVRTGCCLEPWTEDICRI